MNKKIFEINNLTKDYGSNKGVFNLNMIISKGEIFGFLGPNGAGKTTTIRNIMGFIKPDNGSCQINGLDCFKDADIIQKNIGYISGETAFMNDMTGIEFIKFMAEYRNLIDLTNAYKLIKRFNLDSSVRIKRMSKGMKQKVAIVIAFMHDPDILILDEPTSGLDPLMQQEFIKLLLEEKEKGKTILMSSHMFEEVEKTCDRVAIIKDGKIISTDKIDNLKKIGNKVYTITFKNTSDIEKFKNSDFKIDTINENKISLTITDDINNLIKELSKYHIIDFSEEKQHLEDIFMKFYGGENND